MKLLRITGWVISLLAIVYIIYKIFQSKVDLASLLNSSTIPYLVIGLISHVISLFILSQSYFYLCGLFQKMPVNRVVFINFYAKTNLAKYLPGNMMHLVSRNMGASEVGASQRPVFISSFLEIILILLAALLLIVLINPTQIGIILSGWRLLPIIIIITLFIVLFLFVIPGFRSIKHQIQWNANLILKGTGLIGLYVLVLGFQALIPVVIAFSIINVPMEMLMVKDIMNGFLVSWTVGFLTLGAPGGMGVREVIFCSLIPDIPQDSLLLISVAQRLVNMTGDMVFFLLMLLSMQMQKRNSASFDRGT